MFAESGAKASKVAETEMDLTFGERKEKCRKLMEKIVSMRSQYPKHIKKIDLRIAHEEQKLLKRDLDQKLPAESNHITPEPLFDSTLFEECRQMENDLSRRTTELTSQLGNLEKIAEQIRNDNIHRVTRDPIDAKTIINRAKEQKTCSK